MTIVKTHALVLRITPYSNTSHVVVWLTEAGERISTLIKGALRPKSDFLGQYGLFCGCELLYYRRDGDGLHIARECALLEARTGLRRNWRAFGGASYISHLILNTSMEGQRDPLGYHLAQTAFDALDTGGARQEAVFWFELQWLKHLGFSPQLQQCTRCHRPLGARETHVLWATEGVVCGACADTQRTGGPSSTALATLRPDVLAILRRWQAQPDAHVMATTQCSERQVLEFDRLLGMLIADHMDNTPESRKIALLLMRSGFGANGSSK